MRVLVVDDNRVNLKIAEGYLQYFFPQYDILLCQMPENVMDILKEHKVDIILLDIMMPVVDGFEVLKLIRDTKEYNDIQIIMLTAVTDMDSFRTCFEYGANDFIRKPIDETEFHARVKAASNTRNNILLLNEMFERMKAQNNELKVVNAKLKDTQFHLVQSEKMAAIGELAAGVAHEINNPIGYIGSNLETLSSYLIKMKQFIQYNMERMETLTRVKKGDSDLNIIDNIFDKYKETKISYIMEDLEDIIKDSQDGITKVAEIVNTLRNFARTGIENEKTLCSINEIISQVLLIVKNEAKYNVFINFDKKEDIEAYCNNGQIGQVILNIVINAIQAIKSMERKEMGQIKISTYSEDEYICVSVLDNGPGIPKKNLDRIFDPFFTTKEVGQGTGLGLSISHDIVVNKHKGFFDVKSTEGAGTEFIIKLPRKIDYEEVI